MSLKTLRYVPKISEHGKKHIVNQEPTKSNGVRTMGITTAGRTGGRRPPQEGGGGVVHKKKRLLTKYTIQPIANRPHGHGLSLSVCASGSVGRSVGLSVGRSIGLKNKTDGNKPEGSPRTRKTRRVFAFTAVFSPRRGGRNKSFRHCWLKCFNITGCFISQPGGNPDQKKSSRNNVI